MPPKRGQKRKATTRNNATPDDNAAHLSPPDRANWPGWVEMESEPAFFNVMLKDMGVRGVKVQEVYGLEDDMLAILPHPVHALIFLFKYREADMTQQEAGACPKHIWFANQVPDFACATFALLNIVNNIPDLNLGEELQRFKDFTQDMDPLSRGDAIDSFDFVRRIHNSFASENDMLQADKHMKAKADKLRKKRSVAKGLETKRAKQTGATPTKTPLKENSANATNTTPARASNRKKPASESPSQPHSPHNDLDGDFSSSKSTKSKAAQQSPKSTKSEPNDKDEQPEGPRRSARQPKPRTDKLPATSADTTTDDDGFHFIAYMPIQGRVWKLDGLDRFPQDVGSIEDAGGNWIHIAQPALMGRMAQYEESDIQYNLMAIVHDTVTSDRQSLMQNVKTLQTLDGKLDTVYDDWRAMEGAETGREVVTATSLDFGITPLEVAIAEVDAVTMSNIEKEDDLLALIRLRGEIITQQASIRGVVRDAWEVCRGDEEKARHRRHDYGAFVRSWLGALAEREVLAGLVDG